MSGYGGSQQKRAVRERRQIMQMGSPSFEAYNRTLRRVMWADFIDEQLRVAREQQYRASLVEEPFQGQQSIVASFAATRQPSPTDTVR